MIVDDIMFEHDPNEMLEEEKHQDIDDLAVADSNSDNNNEVDAKEESLLEQRVIRKEMMHNYTF